MSKLRLPIPETDISAYLHGRGIGRIIECLQAVTKAVNSFLNRGSANDYLIKNNISTTYGLTYNSTTDKIEIYEASNAQIRAFTEKCRPITPHNLKTAVIEALVASTTLTDEQKASIKANLGVDEQTAEQ